MPIAQFRCSRCGTPYECWVPDAPFERGEDDPEPHCPVCPQLEEQVEPRVTSGRQRVIPRVF